MIIQQNKGFTLLELLVSIAIFAVVMTTASGIFGTALQNQRRTLTQQLVMNNNAYALEYMSRALRMAKKDVDGECLNTGDICNYDNPGGDVTKIRFLNHERKCVEFYLENDQIKRKKSSTSTDSFDSTGSFTSDDIDIQKLEFKLKGPCQSDQPDEQQQPTVTILLNAKITDEVSFRTQTTVTQRDLDIPR